MSEKLKKKPSFSFFKRDKSKSEEPESPTQISPKTPTKNVKGDYEKAKLTVQRRPPTSIQDNKVHRLSIGGIKELVQCTLCMELLNNAKMLPCQHTFCLNCLVYNAGESAIFICPMCNTKMNVSDPSYFSRLPSNVYIDSLLQLVGKTDVTQASTSGTPPSTPSPKTAQSVELHASSVRCNQCKSVCDYKDTTNCEHCKQSFCRICWSQHLDDMKAQIASIMKQIESANTKLQHKLDNYKDRCEHLLDLINITAEEKIVEIEESKTKLIEEATDLQKSGEMSALALQTSLDDARTVATRLMTSKEDTKDEQQVTTFVNLHQNAVQLLTDVSKWDTEHFVFDKENFRIELDASTPLEAESDDPLPLVQRQNNPLESEDTLFMHYRSKNFIPHYVWKKTARPSGIGLSPWNNHLYICGMDTHSVLVVERTQAKIVSKLSSEDMLCPVQIAFMKSLGEIYITDKWKHCIHVFTKDGEYLRCIGHKGSRLGMFRSPEGIATDNANLHIYVVDTGNDRVQILNAEGKVIDQIGVTVKQQTIDSNSVWQTIEKRCTELNAPTSVAVTNDRVIILDSGNRRVKIYNKLDKNKILEFGSLGQRKGQFRQPEVLTVDPMGFILVGDSGNSRIQVFKPTGQLVRVFGGYGTEPGKFGWISGIHVTKQLDIIISDTKNHSVNFI